MGYLPIEDYGVIGDMRSIALVGVNGHIDWCCLPDFDSPSVFGALLDAGKGGYLSLSPVDDCEAKQIYLPDTNVLVTRFFGERGMAEVTDFMPVSKEAGGQSVQCARQIVRIAKVIRGPMRFRLECRPAFDYARQPHSIEPANDGRSVVFTAASQVLVLKGVHPLRIDGDGAVTEFDLNSGEQAEFSLRYCGGRDPSAAVGDEIKGEGLLTETVRFWRGWSSRNRYHGRWREMVMRSALVLKLMTFRPTGAIVAAPTTSLPEEIGGVRNWDYRYAWVRDSAFTVYSLMRLGYTEEAAAFALFIQERAKEAEPNNGPLNVMYGIDGRHDLPEWTLDHLEGYRGSRPVRVGNAAAHHLQLDIYGELLDSIYLYDKYGAPVTFDMWTTAENMLDWVADHWRDPDQSIWEVRGGPKEFTYSRLQCWVALDRGIRLARKRSLPSQGHRWLEERNLIYREIMTRGWDERQQSFTQAFDAPALDASSLMMPLMLFVSPTDPRMTGTINRIRRELAFDSLVRRYDTEKAADDGLPGSEGFFTVCSFWLVEAMSRAGQVEDAQLLFEKVLSFANHLGLFSEEISGKGEMIGNYPQALTHLALISAAYNLDSLLG